MWSSRYLVSCCTVVIHHTYTGDLGLKLLKDRVIIRWLETLDTFQWKTTHRKDAKPVKSLQFHSQAGLTKYDSNFQVNHTHGGGCSAGGEVMLNAVLRLICPCGQSTTHWCPEHTSHSEQDVRDYWELTGSLKWHPAETHKQLVVHVSWSLLYRSNYGVHRNIGAHKVKFMHGFALPGLQCNACPHLKCINIDAFLIGIYRQLCPKTEMSTLLMKMQVNIFFLNTKHRIIMLLVLHTLCLF